MSTAVVFRTVNLLLLVVVVGEMDRRSRGGCVARRVASPVVLVKLLDDLFESRNVCLAELEQVFQVQDEHRQIASPIMSRDNSGSRLVNQSQPTCSAFLDHGNVPLLEFGRGKVGSPLWLAERDKGQFE